MIYIIAFLVSLAMAWISTLGPGPDFVKEVSGKLPVLLAVLIAAVFVRLARGLPSLPFDKIDRSQAARAISAFRALVKAYVQTFAIFVTAIVVNLYYSNLAGLLIDNPALKILTFVDSFLNMTVLWSLYFLVKSDVALAIIQADLMDDVTSRAEVLKVDSAVSRVRDSFKIERS